MQIRAIVEAACDLVKEGLPVKPEIMIPLVGTEREMQLTGTQAREIADEVIAKAGVKRNRPTNPASTKRLSACDIGER